MSEGVASPSGAQSDAFKETDLSVEPFRLALTSSHPDRVKHVSQMPSVEQQRGPDADSDSGDSLFITQKCVPERRRRSSKRSDFRTHRDASEHEYDTSSSEEEQRSGRKRRTEGFRTPRFTFPFLQKTLTTRLPYYQNRKLHYYAMGGYFRCVEELWESYQTGEGQAASSRTVDVDGEPLSPMSEEEHGSAEGEELKVVEKKLFVASRAKSSQPWYNPKKTSSEETRQERSNAGSGSQRGQILTGASLSNETSYLKTKGSDESPGETELGNGRAAKAGNLPAEAETGKTNGSPRKKSEACDLFPKETGESLVNGLSAEQRGRESAEPHAGVGEQIEQKGDDDERSRIKAKKGKKKEKRDKRGDERVDGEPAEGQPADPSLSVNVAEAQEAPCMERKKKKKKKRESEEWSQKVDGRPEEREEDHSVSMWETEIGGQERRETKEGRTDSAPEPTADDGHVLKKRKKKKKDPDGSSVPPQTPTEHLEAIDHLEDGEASQEASDPSGFKRNKLKKKKKRRSLPDDNQTDVDLSNDAATVAEDTDSVKKKKPKKVSEPVRLPEQEESVDDAQEEKQDVELESRKKKKKKMGGDIGLNNAVDSLASSDNTELVRKKKKKKKWTASFLSADTEENVGQGPEEQGTPVRTASAHMGKSEISAGDSVAQSADVSEHRQESKGVKKKKKRSAAPPEGEEREAEETSEAGVKKKKKRKRTESLTGGLESVADEERSPPAEAAAVRKKKKKQKKGSQDVLTDAAEHAESEKLASNPCGSLSSSRWTTETRLTEGAPGTVKERKKKKPAERNVAEGKSETQQTRKDATKPAADPISTSPPTFPSAHGTTSSRRIEGKTGGRVKRRLHNPEQDFLSEPSC
ncbi:apoptotic chromatin condensation inducer in the nucleus [Fundulus heteroclitus]|uniref:apoptotic chromatin condensation inducer in the nucleus n=1 Tax=Fundulus heteroclitus TaxID=8078 RepID=UPI00165AA784|nr:apoptotic chromatin condensation inducer in the nucleus [Fundulus heteroclitus]